LFTFSWLLVEENCYTGAKKNSRFYYKRGVIWWNTGGTGATHALAIHRDFNGTLLLNILLFHGNLND